MFNLSQYGEAITNDEQGELILNSIREIVLKGQIIEIDFSKIKSMTTYCAKQIFGTLYVELGNAKFFNNIKLLHVSQDLKIIINQGIESKLEKK
jgi:hypothetical protein